MTNLALAFSILAVGATPQASVPPRAALTAERPRVEVTFVLDTTGSMGGLIEGAKRRIWSIARRIGEGQPRPELRIALVAYRDRGDQYVTRVFDFTSDMDDVYANLMSLRAEGGGDTPEHVSAALSDAVHKVSWSRGRGMRVIFLVGDAPPHVDYQDGFDYRRHVTEAAARGIGIEPIQCGGDPSTAAVWREVASLGGGTYARIDADGGMPIKATPVDAELARLNSELAATVVAGGSLPERQKTDAKLQARAAMAAPAAAEAASYFAQAGRLADKDLVDMPIAEQKKEIAASRESGSPTANLAGKSDAEALAYLADQKARRSTIEARIASLQKKREALLAGPAAAKDAFDQAVVDSLRARGEAAGIRY
jgi:von Willebrand factor type A domain